MPGPASRLLPQNSPAAGPSVGRPVDAQAGLPNLDRGGPAPAGRNDRLHAARRGGIPAQGDPQAERLAAPRNAARSGHPAELPADRPRAAGARSPAPAGMLHQAGRRAVSQPVAGALPATGAGADSL